MQSRRDPSFFFTNKTGAPQGEVLGLMNPWSSNSCNCSFSSLSSAGAILYGGKEIGVVPATMSIQNSISLSGGSPGNSSGKMSRNSLTTGTCSIAIGSAVVSSVGQKWLISESVMLCWYLPQKKTHHHWEF